MQVDFENGMRSALEGLVWLLENVEGGDEDEGVDSVQWGSGRLHHWAHVLDDVSDLPVLLCVGGKRYANQTIIDFAEETLDSSTAKRIESAVSAETRHQLFTKGYDGNTIYVPSAAIVVRVDDSPSCKNWEVDIHESVHVSQFILEHKYGKYSHESGSVQETQSEIVERYCGILKQLRSKVRKVAQKDSILDAHLE